MSNFKRQDVVLEDSHFSTGNGGLTVRIVETQWVPSNGGQLSSPEYALETEMSHYGHVLKTSTPLIDPASTEEIVNMLNRVLQHMAGRRIIHRQSRISQRVVDGIPIVEQIVAD